MRRLFASISIGMSLSNEQAEGGLGLSRGPIRTNKQVVSCRIEVLQRVVKPQRHTALLTIHLSCLGLMGALAGLPGHGVL